MDEFYAACAERFPKEENPTYRYPSWENIPSFLINRNWICPNILEIRDAMEHLDESEYDYFVKWCRYHGHNLATDDANLLVAHFQDMHGSTTDCTDEPPDLSEEALLYQSIIGCQSNYNLIATDIFNDDYN
ncbi:hypothetical protein [Bacteroides reticulotermitis]|uniref:hypothetical protein n=1 Tax=Bacteroides reticulotermitis TaxID=1133319 RepID=UPI003A854574